MNKLMRSLRFRLAVTGFLTAYAPTLLLLIIALSLSISEEINETYSAAGEVTRTVEQSGLPVWMVIAVAIGFAPFAALLAWWWSGRAVRPLSQAIGLQGRMMEETSHELRTPLAILSTNAEVLLNHPAPTLDIYRQGLKRTEAAANQMKETINTLFIDARGQARTIDRRPTDLAKTAQSVLDSLTVLADKHHVTLNLQTEPSIEARVDDTSVERAITNLVTNAIQHSPPEATVDIHVAGKDGFVEIGVTDKGPGIKAENQSKIFERYWQSEPRNGSGIGLAIVRQVAIAHGGAITVKSPTEDGKGSRFNLRLRA